MFELSENGHFDHEKNNFEMSAKVFIPLEDRSPCILSKIQIS